MERAKTKCYRDLMNLCTVTLQDTPPKRVWKYLSPLKNHGRRFSGTDSFPWVQLTVGVIKGEHLSRPRIRNLGFFLWVDWECSFWSRFFSGGHAKAGRCFTYLSTFSPTEDIGSIDRFRLIIFGAIQFGLMYAFYMRAYQFIPSHLVAIFSILTPYMWS